MKHIRKGADMPVRFVHCRRTAPAAFLAGALGFAGVTSAHHSYAIFDLNKTVTVEGTVKEFQWTNPHAWIEVVVVTPEGSRQYSIEGHNLRASKAMGWTFNTLQPGDKVTIAMHPFRSVSRVARWLPLGSLMAAR